MWWLPLYRIQVAICQIFWEQKKRKGKRCQSFRKHESTFENNSHKYKRRNMQIFFLYIKIEWFSVAARTFCNNFSTESRKFLRIQKYGENFCRALDTHQNEWKFNGNHIKWFWNALAYTLHWLRKMFRWVYLSKHQFYRDSFEWPLQQILKTLAPPLNQHRIWLNPSLNCEIETIHNSILQNTKWIWTEIRWNSI